jgi:hypothetical protein
MDIERFKDRFGVTVAQNGSQVTVIKISIESNGFY